MIDNVELMMTLDKKTQHSTQYHVIPIDNKIRYYSKLIPHKAFANCLSAHRENLGAPSFQHPEIQIIQNADSRTIHCVLAVFSSSFKRLNTLVYPQANHVFIYLFIYLCLRILLLNVKTAGKIKLVTMYGTLYIDCYIKFCFTTVENCIVLDISSLSNNHRYIPHICMLDIQPVEIL